MRSPRALLHSETNNNRSSGSLYVGPDLIVSALSAPGTAGAGKTFTVTETTRNQGAGDAGGSTTRFWLSTNSSLDAGDEPLGTRTVPPLAAGATDAATTTLTVPPDTTTGTYYVIGQADTANAVVETSESNNDRNSGTVKIGGDLVVSALGARASGWRPAPSRSPTPRRIPEPQRCRSRQRGSISR